ncbi:hypothetical protein VTK73DRAFT_593 [Phialemonium thermophilum]|uniref:Uncharacterized protein n=1 Tax=Phialemonium thermophilum TaxID=223376 RepID=A0ABR3VUM2_9PEZI
MLGEICGIAGPYLEEGGEDDDDMDIDTPGHGGGGGGGGGGGRGGGAAADLRGETTRAAVEAIARGYNRQKMRADALAELERVAVALQYRDPRKLLPGDDDEHVLLTGDDVAKPFLAAPRFEALRRTFWYGCAAEVMQDAAAAKGAESSLSSSRGKVRIVAVLRWFLATLDLDVAAAGHGTEEQRMARADAVAAVLRLGKACGGLQAGEQEGEKAELVRELRSGVEEARKGDRSLEVQKRWKVCLELLEG